MKRYALDSNRVVRKLKFPNKFQLKTAKCAAFARLVRQVTELSNKSNIVSYVLKKNIRVTGRLRNEQLTMSNE
jgi:hypothetical protein